MSRQPDIDLSGRWAGFFNYPDSGPPVNFEAVLREHAGRLTGTTTELGDTPDTLGRVLNGVIDGHRDGASVHFIKMYEEADEEYDVVHYSGRVEAGGNEIAGRWEIPRIWSGTFLMVRNAGTAEPIERAVEETVPSP